MAKRKTVDSIVICMHCGIVSLRRYKPERLPSCRECTQTMHLPDGQDALMAAWLIGGPEAVIPELLKEPKLRGAMLARSMTGDILRKMDL